MTGTPGTSTNLQGDDLDSMYYNWSVGGGDWGYGYKYWPLEGCLGLWELVLTSREMTWALGTSTYVLGRWLGLWVLALTYMEMYGTIDTSTDLNGDNWDSGY